MRLSFLLHGLLPKAVLGLALGFMASTALAAPPQLQAPLLHVWFVPQQDDPQAWVGGQQTPPVQT